MIDHCGCGFDGISTSFDFSSLSAEFQRCPAARIRRKSGAYFVYGFDRLHRILTKDRLKESSRYNATQDVSKHHAMVR